MSFYDYLAFFLTFAIIFIASLIIYFVFSFTEKLNSRDAD